jgi:hypothetical protein
MEGQLLWGVHRVMAALAAAATTTTTTVVVIKHKNRAYKILI